MKSISVIIPTYNYGRFISDAIRSVLAQTYRPLETIVVDDGSTDGTEEVVGLFGDAVTYIRQSNAGVCAARNHGVERSSGELIAFLDADDVWEPSKLERQSSKFDRDDIGLVHSGMREFDGETGHTIRLHLDGAEDDAALSLLLWEGIPVNVSGSAVMVSRKAFDAVGGFDTQMKVGEDWDFCYRIARQFKVGFVPEPLVNYRSHAAAAHRDVREMERGMALFYAKAFAPGGDVLDLKRRAYSNFHRVLAGSYFQSGDYAQFIKHSAISLWKRPGGITYFLKFPLRRYRANQHR